MVQLFRNNNGNNRNANLLTEFRWRAVMPAASPSRKTRAMELPRILIFIMDPIRRLDAREENGRDGEI